MVDIELINNLVLKSKKANPDHNSQEVLEDVIKEYCKKKAPTNYQKNEAVEIANEMIQNMVSG